LIWDNYSTVYLCITTEGYNKTFDVKVGLHQGSVLSLLLLVILWRSWSKVTAWSLQNVQGQRVKRVNKVTPV